MNTVVRLPLPIKKIFTLAMTSDFSLWGDPENMGIAVGTASLSVVEREI
jgi:hypothetical protein